MSLSMVARFRYFPLFLVCYELAAYLSNDMYLPALPHMIVDLASNAVAAKLTITAWFLGSASLQLILGPLTDYYGRRPVLLTGGVLFVLATLACGLTDSMSVFLFARFIQGVTVTSLLISGYAAVNELCEQKDAVILIAWMNSFTVLAPALGPLLGALMIQLANWRSIFYLLAALSAISLMGLYRVMPETKKDERSSLNMKALAASYFRILTTPNYVFHAFTAGTLFSGLIAWIAVGPFIIMTLYHGTLWQFGIYQLFACLMFIAGCRLNKPLLSRLSIPQLINLGLVVLVAGAFLTFYGALYQPSSMTAGLVGLMCYQLGAGLAFSSLHRSAVEASDEPMGARIAIYSGFITSAGAMGSFATTWFQEPSWLSLSEVMIVASLFSVFLQTLRYLLASEKSLDPLAS